MRLCGLLVVMRDVCPLPELQEAMHNAIGLQEALHDAIGLQEACRSCSVGEEDCVGHSAQRDGFAGQDSELGLSSLGILQDGHLDQRWVCLSSPMGSL